MPLIKIRGCSDDIIEVDLAGRELEYGFYSDCHVFLVFDTGTAVRCIFGEGDHPGWKFELVKTGIGDRMLSHEKATDEENHTDRLVIETNVIQPNAPDLCKSENGPDEDEILEMLQKIEWDDETEAAIRAVWQELRKFSSRTHAIGLS